MNLSLIDLWNILSGVSSFNGPNFVMYLQNLGNIVILGLVLGCQRKAMVQIITGLGHCGICGIKLVKKDLCTLYVWFDPTCLSLTIKLAFISTIHLQKAKVQDKQRCSSLAARLKSSGLMGNRWRFTQLTRFNFLIRTLQWTRRNPTLVLQKRADWEGWHIKTAPARCAGPPELTTLPCETSHLRRCHLILKQPEDNLINYVNSE